MRRIPSPAIKGRSAVRCAIYTRKSSEEGLEQAFNSLDAQRVSMGTGISAIMGFQNSLIGGFGRVR